MKTVVIYGDGIHDDTEAMAAIANGTAPGDLVRVSVCCEAPIGVDGGTTLFYRCTKCGMPCDAKVVGYWKPNLAGPPKGVGRW